MYDDEEPDITLVALGLVVPLVLFVIVIAVLVGCSPGESNEQKVKTSVEQYSTAIFSGDTTKAFGMMSDRCQERMGRHPMIEAWTAIAKENKGSPIPKSITVKLDNDRTATVAYTFEDERWNQENEVWSETDGVWVNDEC
jgi:uncharacterized membrane protein YeiB